MSSVAIPFSPKARGRHCIGVYLSPPENAIVFSESQIQALDRTQPGLPLKKGRAGTMTHDYKRNGVISECMPRRRQQEWLEFLKKIDAEVLKDLKIHIICDNYATHKHPKVLRWIKKNGRIHLHFTPTSASWLNMVERFFRDLTCNRIRRGAFGSTAALVAAIEDYVAAHNQDPKPFIWTKSARDILAKVVRAREALPVACLEGRGGATTA